MVKLINNLPEIELFSKGHNACYGCGASLAMRLVMKAAGKNTIVTQATGCMEVVSTPYPLTAWEVPFLHSAFENAAATASGIARSLKMQGNKDTKVLAIAGDGGAFDIGLQALSGALERQEKITFICYDNEGYQNTGRQRSGATPVHASTTTTPIGKKIHGKLVFKKPMPLIMAVHRIPYIATANIAYPQDLVKKVQKALKLQPSYVQILCPCIPGWKMPQNLTINIAKLAVETRMQTLYEIENRELTINKHIEKPKPVKEYLKLQGRFKNLSNKDIQEIQQHISQEYSYLTKLEKQKAKI
jgi:pyruvate ferredoxin oxidoreductase beta subunit